MTQLRKLSEELRFILGEGKAPAPETTAQLKRRLAYLRRELEKTDPGEYPRYVDLLAEIEVAQADLKARQ